MPDKLPSKEQYFIDLLMAGLSDLLSNRVNDVPHRFRAPKALEEFFHDYGVNQSYYHQLPLNFATRDPLMLQITTRPTQKILELIFQGPDGTRLFTLEIEYGKPEA